MSNRSWRGHLSQDMAWEDRPTHWQGHRVLPRFPLSVRLSSSGPVRVQLADLMAIASYRY